MKSLSRPLVRAGSVRKLDATIFRAMDDDVTNSVSVKRDFAKVVGAKIVLPIPFFNKEYTIDCTSAAPALDVVLGGKTYSLEKEDYVINDQGQCLFGMTDWMCQHQQDPW